MGVVSNKTDITDLQKGGGGGDLEPRVRALELEDIKLAEGLALVQTSVNSLKSTVGDSSSGLVKDLSDLADVVGDSSSGLVKDVDDLDTTVGDNNSGLVKSVSDLSTAVTGKMDTSTYDSTAAVATAGGIVAYINDTVAAALSASY